MRGVVLASCRNSSPKKNRRIFPRNACERNTKKTPQERWKNKAGDHPCLFTLTTPISIHHFLGVTHRLKKRLNLQQTPRTSTLVSVCLGGIGKTIWGMIINYRSLSANTLPPLQFHVHIYIYNPKSCLSLNYLQSPHDMSMLIIALCLYICMYIYRDNCVSPRLRFHTTRYLSVSSVQRSVTRHAVTFRALRWNRSLPGGSLKRPTCLSWRVEIW